MKTVYPIIIYKKEPGEKYHIVYIPDLKKATQGEDYFECIEMARDLIGLSYIDSLEDNKEMPKPFKSSKKSAFDDLVIESESLVEIDLLDYKRKLENKSIKKTLTIPYNLNARAEAKGINFSKLLKESLERELQIK